MGRSKWLTYRTYGAVLAACLFGAFHARLYDAPFEDAFVTFRYAENFASGRGLVFNAGEHVEGFTSFGWTLLLALAKRVGLGVPATASALSLFFGVALLVVTARLTKEVTRATDASIALPAFFVGAQGTFAYWSATGMETTLFALLVCAGLLCAVRGEGALAGLLFGVGTLVRPESIGYAAVVLATLALERQARRSAAIGLGVFLLVFVPYFLWRWRHFGFLLPNTYYAKVGDVSGRFGDGLDDVGELLTANAFWLVPPALFVVRRALGATRWLRLFVAVLVAAVVNDLLVGGDIFAFHRFLLPAIPVGAIALYVAGRAVVLRASEAPKRSRTLVLASVLASVLLVGWEATAPVRPRGVLMTSKAQTQWDRVEGVAAIGRDFFDIGAFLRDNFPPTTWLAINAIGIVPYVSRLPTIDMLGLTDVHIAHRPATSGARGHQKHDGAYVLSRTPDVVLLGVPLLTKRAVRADELEAWLAKTFPFLQGDAEIFHDPRFVQSYVPYCVQLHPQGWLTLFVRRGVEPPSLVPFAIR